MKPIDQVLTSELFHYFVGQTAFCLFAVVSGLSCPPLVAGETPGAAPKDKAVSPTDADAALDAVVRRISTKLPAGWSSSRQDDSFLLRRKAEVFWLPLIGRPPQSDSETEAEYYERNGARIVYEIKLRFVARLSADEIRRLRVARSQVEELGKGGFRTKTDLSEYLNKLDRHRLPAYYTSKYSIYVGYVGPLTIRPTSVREEVERIIKLMDQEFGKYDRAGPAPYGWPY